MAQSTSRNKVLHTSNLFDKVSVKYETPEGEIKTSEMKPNWYFAIKEEDGPGASKLLNQENFKFSLQTDIKFPNFLKVYYRIDGGDRYSIVRYLESNGVETFEGDLLPDKRWYIDTEVLIADNYKKLYFDIETDDSQEKLEIGRDRILSYAAIDDKGKKYFQVLEELTDEAEKELLKKFLRLISKYDILLGWNSKGFDVPYLKERMRRYELHKTDSYVWREVAHFDLCARFRHIFRFDSHIRTFALDFIANHFLGKGKIEHSEKIIDLWKNDRDRLKEYNLEDSILVKELDEKLGVSQMMIRQSQWCGVPVGQFGLYSIIDAHIMKTAHRAGKFVKTSMRAIEERSLDNIRGNVNPNDTDTGKAKYSGALVLDPKIGKYDGVHTFDFKGLYPSMMRTSNIGYDTIRYAHSGELMRNPGTMQMPRKAGGWKATYFIKEPSVINLAISELITKRSEYKKLKLQMIEERKNKGPEWERIVSDEIIVKELANSTYGIMGLEYGRYFSIDIAESITLFGQWCILFAKKFFEEHGYKVIYGDTDSVFVVTGKKPFDIQKYLDLFHEKLKFELKEVYNIDHCYIELAFDKKYETLILIEKKTYVGHVTNMEGKQTDEIYARGLDYIKKNTFGYAGERQKELIEYILHQDPPKEVMKTYLRKIRDEFYKKDFSKEELMITQKVGKDLDDYKGTSPLHVRLAKGLTDKTGQTTLNTEVEYIVTNNYRGMQGIMASDFKGDYDRDYYWENKTQPLLDRVTGVVYPGEDFFSNQLTLFS